MNDIEIKEPIWQSIPLAQNAFDETVKKYDPVDITKYLPKIVESIKLSIDHGYLCARVGPYEVLEAEKIALELESKYGYRTTTFQSGISQTNQILAGVDINWKFISSGTRERLN